MIGREFQIRVDLGQPTCVEDFLQRFPEHADALRSRLEAYLSRNGDVSGSATPVTHDTSSPGAPGVPGPLERDGFRARLGGFRLRKRLGEGGMGIVFRAYDPRLDCEVALKIMKPEVAAIPSCRQRFLGEAQAMAALRSNEHVVMVDQSGEVGLATPAARRTRSRFW